MIGRYFGGIISNMLILTFNLCIRVRRLVLNQPFACRVNLLIHKKTEIVTGPELMVGDTCEQTLFYLNGV